MYVVYGVWLFDGHENGFGRCWPSLYILGSLIHAQILPLWVAKAPMLWVQLHTVTVTAFAAKARAHEREGERLCELSISLFTCGCECVCVCAAAAAAADVATKTSHCHFVSSLQWHWNLISFLAKERTHKSSIQSNCAIYRSTFVPTLFEFRIESSSPVDFVRNLMLHCCLSQVPRISQLCARINALSYMECNSCGVYHISVCSLLYIICN